MTKLFLFLLFPILEIYLLIKVGAAIGAMKVLVWIFLSAFLGIWFMRTQGSTTLLQARRAMGQGIDPHTTAFDGIFIVLGGVLLILPGFISDALGLLLLLPFTRKILATASLLILAKNVRAKAQTQNGRFVYFKSAGGQGRTFSNEEAQSADPRQDTIIDCTVIETSTKDNEEASPIIIVDCEDTDGAASGSKK